MKLSTLPARHLLLLCGVGLVILIAACRSQQASVRPLNKAEVIRLERSSERPRSRACQNLAGYDPALYSAPLLYVRGNFHFMNHSDSSANSVPATCSAITSVIARATNASDAPDISIPKKL